MLVPLVVRPDGLHLLLTRRAETLPTHKGEVAFPGGGFEPGDNGPTGTALREAKEEIDLPESAVEILGELDDFPTLGGETIVTPVVGVIQDLPPLVPAPGEVARIFTIPLAELQKKSGWQVRPWSRRGKDFPVFYFDWDGETLWGLSAYITIQLMSLAAEGGPFELPPPYGNGDPTGG